MHPLRKEIQLEECVSNVDTDPFLAHIAQLFSYLPIPSFFRTTPSADNHVLLFNSYHGHLPIVYDAEKREMNYTTVQAPTQLKRCIRAPPSACTWSRPMERQ